MKYSAYPGEKIYTYNEKMEVTEVLYPDGSKEIFGYDARNNRILETDRLGRNVHKEYDSAGHLIKESRPEGLITEYYYDEAGNLICVSDNSGRERQLIYDENHNLINRKDRNGESRWSEESYSYDRMGRLTQG